MTFLRYQLLKLAVTLVIFAISVIPALYIIGSLSSLTPIDSYSIAFWIGAVLWFVGMALGTHVISKKLAKRWSW